MLLKNLIPKILDGLGSQRNTSQNFIFYEKKSLYLVFWSRSWSQGQQQLFHGQAALSLSLVAVRASCRYLSLSRREDLLEMKQRAAAAAAAVEMRKAARPSFFEKYSSMIFFFLNSCHILIFSHFFYLVSLSLIFLFNLFFHITMFDFFVRWVKPSTSLCFFRAGICPNNFII